MLTESSRALRARPPEVRPWCEGHCRFLLVSLTETEHTWRCERCLRYLRVTLEVAQGTLF